MTALPTWMEDRWEHRAEPGPGEGTVYWHMPMHDHPQVIDLVRLAQQRLAPFGDLHMTPLERLHMTTMVAGPADQFSSGQLDQMASTGHDAAHDDLERWIPHITVCYSTAHQPAAPLIAALGESLPRCDIQISAFSLMIQRGPERHWDWSTIATIRLAA